MPWCQHAQHDPKPWGKSRRAVCSQDRMFSGDYIPRCHMPSQKWLSLGSPQTMSLCLYKFYTCPESRKRSRGLLALAISFGRQPQPGAPDTGLSDSSLLEIQATHAGFFVLVPANVKSDLLGLKMSFFICS